MTKSNTSLRSIERAASDMRRGVPIIVRSADRALLVLAMEQANAATVAAFDALAHNSFMLITNRRAAALKVAGKGWSVVRTIRPDWFEPSDFLAVADPSLDLATPLKGPFERIDHSEEQVDKAAVKLAKVAQLLPAVIAAEVGEASAFADHHDLLCVDADTLLANDELQAQALTQVAAAKVPLGGAEDTRLIAFRPKDGSLEHVAILIGAPSRQDPVLMRIHSECFTGDLLGSLKCDCGEQLRGAIAAIAEAGGGVLLYLAQEGRGIGLISKLKAYALQDQGYDTVDANTKLGFEVDERVFAPAAEMLKKLGFKTVRLMTNNPDKVEGLQECGIDVVERVSHAFEPNPHNIQYLATKKTRTGHML
ncbi:GTP cyclohydrolase II [Kordiimonas aquimaris]|uniref:GTP cyclohydrolase II n=1 Tax=Kordiimonas aquimaris TaxID=707591 RepID=UPI0021CFF54F|nr:GTP cyclohydrolase II [Kordiimonas aquimaris]